jgi:hypothetical protein
MTTLNPIQAVALKRKAERASSIHGFPSDELRQRMHCVVLLSGLTAANLGHERFGRVLHACLRAAAKIAPGNFIAEAVYCEYLRQGYEFRFGSKLEAARFSLCHEAAMRCQPSPLLEWGQA